MRCRLVRCLLLATIAFLLVPGGALPGRVQSDKAPDFGQWEKSIVAFEREDARKAPPKNPIVFVGSSSIRRWDLPRSFPDLPVVNRGFGGSEMADVAHFAHRIVLKYKPRLIVVYAGDNDIAAGKTPRHVLDAFRSFVRTVRTRQPKAPIIYLSIKFSIRRWAIAHRMREANTLIEAYCRNEHGLRYLDVGTALLSKDGKPRPELFAPDGLHLSAQGYAVWAALLKPYLERANSAATTLLRP